MARKKKPEPDDPEQSARFIELGERIAGENSEKLFKEAFDKIAKVKKKSPKKPA
jgi:hypothetical protein